MRAEPDILAATLGMLEQLIAFDSISSKSNLPLIERVEAYLGEIGIQTVRVPNAAGDKAALFATVGPPIDGGLVLSGHTDVVSVAGQSWTSDPFVLRQEGDKLFGRGACDMKGFDAICLAMMPVFKQARLTRPIHLLLSYDEEIGCLGSLDTIARFGVDLPRPAMALVGEPTEMAVVNAHKSIASYKTIVHGREAHSADPTMGANAVQAGCALVSELYRLQARLEADGDATRSFTPGYSTVHVGMIEGGNARNILARECRFEWEFRGLPGIDQRIAIRHLDNYIERDVLPWFTRHAPVARIETVVGAEVPPLAPDPGSVAELMAKRLTQSTDVLTASYATEAGQFQKNGISTIVCGPGSIRQAHQPDEFIGLPQLVAGLYFMQRLVNDYSS